MLRKLSVWAGLILLTLALESDSHAGKTTKTAAPTPAITILIDAVSIQEYYSPTGAVPSVSAENPEYEGIFEVEFEELIPGVYYAFIGWEGTGAQAAWAYTNDESAEVFYASTYLSYFWNDGDDHVSGELPPWTETIATSRYAYDEWTFNLQIEGNYGAQFGLLFW